MNFRNNIFSEEEINIINENIDNFPISINNYYGDPTLQWNNTINKLKRLKNHKGYIAVITRGLITEEMAKELKELNLNKLTILVSISNLPIEIEPIEKESRYKTIENCLKYNIKVLACVRPLIPELNGSKESIDEMFKNIKKYGCNHVVVSGFRGDDELISKMNLKEKLQWSLRIKLMTKEMTENIKELSKKYNLNVQKRISCGIANLYKERSHNHYFYAKKLLNCADDCELFSSGVCTDAYEINLERLEKEVNILKKIGYDLTLYIPKENRLCNVTAEQRVKCPSCCTSCYVMDVPRVYINNKNITLADTTFVRFFTKVLSTQKGIEDLGDNTGTVQVFGNKQIHLVNSWYVLANEQKKCFNCKYCITNAYDLKEQEYGVFPQDLKELFYGRE